ncbi:hypothetical protein M406DRAFT_346932 [Cryphonectria parasitica EP155]|uniref:LDB19 N-terminal domain-containing protein n=1 Tax=Cryphonectria parasitica (strain ATCC 38755 / EP155) TaxID=660469 RepID=A0A9P5CPI9_CRYP1|nr:uncharacterized protein M406DRAFT_346932 [Cryphonectria parasitica EP155]KAF3765216.1 hypothetical protein M406DRAFT_346932 [Cryphonectria parasitica EP155]
MPHRVASFFRNPTSSFENQVIHLKKSTIRSRTKDGSGGGHDHKEKDSKDIHHHRLSFPGIHLGRSHKEQHTNPHASLSWSIESPPIIFHGDEENSTGALVSGQLFLDIKDESYDIASFKATLNIHVTQKKPYTVHCSDCVNQYTLVKEWKFLPSPGRTLHNGVHPFPFSVLLDGHLPATLDSPLVSIAYEFKAEAIPTRAGSPPIKLEKLFDVKRSLPPPELPHHSVRVFPPTNVKASVHYQQVIHPIGTNTLTMRLDGIAKNNTGTTTVEYWKLKKLTWRLEETLRTVAPACDKHKPAAADTTAADRQKRGMSRTETRVIGEKTLFSGWKSSYAGPTDSSVDLELEYALNKHAKYSCDLKSRDGTEVSHQLMLEMVVSQECAPTGKPGLVTQTGVGRILRMHFGTILTERGGIGISWDNEAPPIYQDVPASPPAYCEDLVSGSLEGIPDVMESLDAAPGPSGTGIIQVDTRMCIKSTFKII